MPPYVNPQPGWLLSPIIISRMFRTHGRVSRRQKQLRLRAPLAASCRLYPRLMFASTSLNPGKCLKLNEMVKMSLIVSLEVIVWHQILTWSTQVAGSKCLN